MYVKAGWGTRLLERISDVEPDSSYFLLLSETVNTGKCLFLKCGIPIDIRNKSWRVELHPIITSVVP